MSFPKVNRSAPRRCHGRDGMGCGRSGSRDCCRRAALHWGTGGDDILDVGDHAGPEDNLAGTFFGFRSTLVCGVDAGQEIRSEGTWNKELGALVDDVVDDGELVAIWPELTKWFRESGAFRRPTVEKNFKQRLKIGVLSRFSLNVVELGWGDWQKIHVEDVQLQVDEPRRCCQGDTHD